MAKKVRCITMDQKILDSIPSSTLLCNCHSVCFRSHMKLIFSVDHPVFRTRYLTEAPSQSSEHFSFASILSELNICFLISYFSLVKHYQRCKSLIICNGSYSNIVKQKSLLKWRFFKEQGPDFSIAQGYDVVKSEQKPLT